MIPRFSIFSIILTYFGANSHKITNNYVDETLRNINIRETLTFNKRCKRNNIIPTSLLQRPPLQSPLGHKISRQNALRYLDGFIQDGYRKLRNSNRHLNYLRSQLQSLILPYLIDEIQQFIEKRKLSYRPNLKKRLIDKYDFLVSKNRPPQNQNSNNWIVNISKHELTEAETSLLNKGLNFSLPNSKKNIPQFIATIENVIDNNFNKFTEVDKTIIRHNVCASLKSVKDDAHQLNREERATLNALKNNEDIFIAPADKGCSIVLMDKSDYFAKVNDHLGDSNTYEKQNNDTSASLRGIINRFLKTLHDRNLLTKSNYLNLFSNSATLPLFYALIKNKIMILLLP